MRTLSGVTSWVGERQGAVRLRGRLAVISPHLDDGILSLGATLSHAARQGVDVSVVTVLAGDTNSSAPAGPWDHKAGYRTAGEAARARRRQDATACAEVGAKPVWLPYSDHQYPRNGDDATILAALVEAVGEAETVLVPGFPLMQEDHLWLRALIGRETFPQARLGLYVEQPYAALWTSGPAAAPGVPEPSAAGGSLCWVPLAATLPDRLTKLGACRRYSSQVPLLGRGALRRMVRYEVRRGGEWVAWLEPGPAPTSVERAS
jgi:LmbE family N-acetylglucosaminyl deacetylase